MVCLALPCVLFFMFVDGKRFLFYLVPCFVGFFVYCFIFFGGDLADELTHRGTEKDVATCEVLLFIA